eukprot:gene15877-22007_t
MAAWTGGGAESERRAAVQLLRMQRLAVLCLEALVAQRGNFQTVLASPRPAKSSVSLPAGTLIETLIMLPSPEQWAANSGAATAVCASLSTALLTALVHGGMFTKLAELLMQLIDVQLTHLPAHLPTFFSPVEPQVIHRDALHSAHSKVPSRQLQAGPPSAAITASGGLLNAATILATLPASLEGGQAVCAAALLGNILSVGSALLADKKPAVSPRESVPSEAFPGASTSSPSLAQAACPFAADVPSQAASPSSAVQNQAAFPSAAVQTTALHLTRVTDTLLSLLPVSPFLPASAVGAVQNSDGDDGDDSSRQQGRQGSEPLQKMAEASSSGETRLQLPKDIMVCSELVEQGSSEIAIKFAEGAQALCQLLHSLTLIPAYRYFVLLTVAVPANFVERLWFSVLQGCRVAESRGYASSGGASSSASGQMSWYTPEAAASSNIPAVSPPPSSYNARSSGEASTSGGGGGGAATSAARFLALLRDSLWQLLWMSADRGPNADSNRTLFQGFTSTCGQLYSQLYGRNCRQAFAPTEAFHAPGLVPERFLKEAAASRSSASEFQDRDRERVWKVLKLAPCLIPFEERAQIFRHEVGQEREQYRDMEQQQSFNPDDPFRQQPGIRFVPIRRSSLLADGYERLNKMGDGLKGRVRVQFINQHDEPEAGVDGGGLFKDFLEELIKEGFSDQHGLFAANDSQQMYPNPGMVGLRPDAPQLLEFLGRMLGKAMYESILVELPFAGFFLKKFRGARCDINDLPTLDPVVYRNLMLLKHYNGDVSDLALSFTSTSMVNGQNVEVELKPGGSNIAVDNDNVVDYLLNQQMHGPASAFLHGFFDVIKPDWVSMFNEEELQMLMSGSEDGLDLHDLQQHIALADWVSIFDEEELQMLMSGSEDGLDLHDLQQHIALADEWECARPQAPLSDCPQPPHMSGSVLDPSAVERLPTAATCMNLLKLPPYPTVELMRRKLLMAIHAGAGFDLS